MRVLALVIGAGKMCPHFSPFVSPLDNFPLETGLCERFVGWEFGVHLEDPLLPKNLHAFVAANHFADKIELSCAEIRVQSGGFPPRFHLVLIWLVAYSFVVFRNLDGSCCIGLSTVHHLSSFL